MIIDEAYRNSFEKGKQDVTLKMKQFSKDVTHRVGGYFVTTSNRIQPFEIDPDPAGLIRVNIRRLDGQLVNPTEIIDLTLQIDERAIASGGRNGAWMFQKREKGQEDRSIFFQWVSFSFELSPGHRQYIQSQFGTGPVQLAKLLQRPIIPSR